MAKYCRFCGKELVNGRCDCAEFLKEEAAMQRAQKASAENNNSASQMSQAAQGNQYTASQETSNSAEQGTSTGTTSGSSASDMRTAMGNAASKAQAQFNDMKNSQQAAEIKKLAGESRVFALNFFLKPADTITAVLNGQHGAEAFTAGGVHLLLIFLLLGIYFQIPVITDLIGGSYGFLLSFFIMIVVLINVLISALVIYLLDKTATGGNHTYGQILKALSLVTLPGSVFLIAAFLFGLFSKTLALLFYQALFTAWSILLGMVAFSASNGDKNIRMRAAVIAVIVINAVFAILPCILAATAIAGVAGGIAANSLFG